MSLAGHFKGRLDALVDEDAEIVTIMYGNDVDEDELKELGLYLDQKYPDVEVIDMR